MRRRMNAEKGFTLMELMVVIVIVAILAAVAVPLYINYVKDAQRTEAKGAIGAIITAEQVYFQKTGSYTATLADLNVDLSDLGTRWGTPAITVTTASGATASFDVTLTQAATPNLWVKVVYTRGSSPVWTEGEGGGGGGGGGSL
jgi:prepilin-type N-terminal cleavage/methylation domain-containing protein